MNDLVTRLAARPLTYRERRVVTLRMIDELHERPDGTAGRNFREHRDRLREGEDYYEVPYAEWSQWVAVTTNFVATEYRGALTLLTEMGYLLLVKSFRDDRAWEVQRALRDHYFQTAKPQSPAEMFLAMAEAFLATERLALAAGHKADQADRKAEAALAIAQSNYGYYSVLGFARIRGMEMPVEAAAAHGRKLTKICKGLGVDVSRIADPRFGRVNTYPESVLEEYFNKAG